MTKYSKTVAKAALAVAIGAATATANAELITDWDYVVTGEWVVGSTVFSEGIAPPPSVPDVGDGVTFESPTLLSWGADTGSTAPVSGADRFSSRSGLEIADTSVTGSIMTNGGPQDTLVVTHFNNTISAQFDSLETAVFLTTLTLTSTAPPPGGDVFSPPSLSIPVNFIETFNSEPCGFDSVSVCDDIFVFAPVDLTQTFHIGDYVYTTFVGSEGLAPLDADTCAEAGLAGPCVGLTTEEEAATPVQFNFEIIGRKKSVPAPATLGLLGLGLLGFAARKRKQQL